MRRLSPTCAFLYRHKPCAGLDGKQPGDAVKLSELIVDIMRGQGFATGRAMPRSLQIGNDCYHQVKKKLRSTLATLEEWKEVIVTTDVGP